MVVTRSPRILVFYAFVHIVIFGIFATTTSAAPLAENRMALVIGNANYQHLTPLRNPARDAKAIGQSLSALGFRVYLATDVTTERLAKSIQYFSQKSDDADVVLIYFAGHGANVAGQNYLFPTDFKPNSAFDPTAAVNLSQVQALLGGELRRSILIIDACQDDPFIETSDGVIDLNTGALLPQTPDVETLIAFSSAAGSATYDGTGRHSLFAGALLDNIGSENIDIELMLRAVRRDVLRSSDGYQLPQTYSSLVSPFFLAPTQGSMPTGHGFTLFQGQKSLDETGFSTKPILSNIAQGLTPDIVDSASDRRRKELRAYLCENIAPPLPIQCLSSAENSAFFAR